MSSRPWNIGPAGPKEGQKFAREVDQEKGALLMGVPTAIEVDRPVGAAQGWLRSHARVMSICCAKERAGSDSGSMKRFASGSAGDGSIICSL